MNQLISQEEAAKLLDRAYQFIQKQPGFRIGQALWNIANQDFPDIMQPAVGSDKDFFYEPCAIKAIEVFFTSFVEE